MTIHKGWRAHKDWKKLPNNQIMSLVHDNIMRAIMPSIVQPFIIGQGIKNMPHLSYTTCCHHIK